MTALHKDDVFVLGIIGAPSGKLSLCLESSMGGADVVDLGIMGAPVGKLSLYYDSSTWSCCLCPWYNGNTCW